MMAKQGFVKGANGDPLRTSLRKINRIMVTSQQHNKRGKEKENYKPKISYFQPGESEY